MEVTGMPFFSSKGAHFVARYLVHSMLALG